MNFPKIPFCFSLSLWGTWYGCNHYRYSRNDLQKKAKGGFWPPFPQLSLSRLFLHYISDTFLLALDLYRTHWEDYLISYPSGEKISPINNKAKHEADIQNITQVRLGAEYLVYYQQQIFPLRAGIFHDPEPVSGSVDDFYGVSLGSEILLKNSVFDIAYQYHFGEKKTQNLWEIKRYPQM